jgi:hypothetical protein
MDNFYADRKPPAESNWNTDLRAWAKLAGIAPYGLSAKTTRKTIESWLIKAEVNESAVCLRAGHDSVTSMKHYQGLAFNDIETQDIIRQLTVWGLVK